MIITLEKTLGLYFIAIFLLPGNFQSMFFELGWENNAEDFKDI